MPRSGTDMRSIGMPELVVMQAVFLFAPIAAIAIVVWLILKRRGLQVVAASRTCASCRQRVPDLGSFCPLCGQKIVQ
jgi:hypothetical protein